MTANQIAWLKANEEARANRAKEAETNRANLAKEAENLRSNIASEALTRTKIIADSANKLAGGLGLVPALGEEISSAAGTDASGRPSLEKSAQSIKKLTKAKDELEEFFGKKKKKAKGGKK